MSNPTNKDTNQKIEETKRQLYELLKTDKRADTYVIPNRVMDIISEQIQKLLVEERIDELNLFWKEALDIYHGIPIDTEVWWYKYFKKREAELQTNTQNKEEE